MLIVIRQDWPAYLTWLTIYGNCFALVHGCDSVRASLPRRSFSRRRVLLNRTPRPARDARTATQPGTVTARHGTARHGTRGRGPGLEWTQCWRRQAAASAPYGWSGRAVRDGGIAGARAHPRGRNGNVDTNNASRSHSSLPRGSGSANEQ